MCQKPVYMIQVTGLVVLMLRPHRCSAGTYNCYAGAVRIAGPGDVFEKMRENFEKSRVLHCTVVYTYNNFWKTWPREVFRKTLFDSGCNVARTRSLRAKRFSKTGLFVDGPSRKAGSAFLRRNARMSRPIVSQHLEG